jgi:hypothetical protein
MGTKKTKCILVVSIFLSMTCFALMSSCSPQEGSQQNGGPDVIAASSLEAIHQDKQVTADTDLVAESCYLSGCHVEKEVIASTEGWDDYMNPHYSHYDDIAYEGSLECGDCHKFDRASVMYCARCHESVRTEGDWEALPLDGTTPELL